MFILISIFTCPMFYLYGKDVGLKGWKSYPIMRFSMGNLGGAQMVCKQNILSRGKMKLDCPPRTYLDTKNAHMALVSSAFDSFD